MDDTSSAWLDDPGREPAAAVEIHAICPNCGQPVQNPTPVLMRAPYVAEALCICANGHTWTTKYNPDPTTPESEDAA